jgi:hypothetical protein
VASACCQALSSLSSFLTFATLSSFLAFAAFPPFASCSFAAHALACHPTTLLAGPDKPISVKSSLLTSLFAAAVLLAALCSVFAAASRLAAPPALACLALAVGVSLLSGLLVSLLSLPGPLAAGLLSIALALSLLPSADPASDRSGAGAAATLAALALALAIVIGLSTGVRIAAVVLLILHVDVLPHLETTGHETVVMVFVMMPVMMVHHSFEHAEEVFHLAFDLTFLCSQERHFLPHPVHALARKLAKLLELSHAPLALWLADLLQLSSACGSLGLAGLLALPTSLKFAELLSVDRVGLHEQCAEQRDKGQLSEMVVMHGYLPASRLDVCSIFQNEARSFPFAGFGKKSSSVRQLEMPG